MPTNHSSSAVSRQTPAVPHTQDQHSVAVNAVTDDVRINDRDLAQLGAKNGSATVGKIDQAVPNRDHTASYPLGRLRIESAYVAADVL